MDTKTDIPYDLLMKIQMGTLAYTYKGMEMLKNPFDLALYTKLIWETRPATIIELGSWAGGSAVWFADQMQIYDIEPRVISIDIEDKITITDDRVRFLVGDICNLEAVLPKETLAALPRPFLVIEDASHMREHSLAALDFFAPVLESGEYLLVEDGILEAMKLADEYDGGPTAAIAEFFEKHPDVYEQNLEYRDFFGQNVTWNTNGFLRKV